MVLKVIKISAKLKKEKINHRITEVTRGNFPRESSSPPEFYGFLSLYLWTCLSGLCVIASTDPELLTLCCKDFIFNQLSLL